MIRILPAREEHADFVAWVCLAAARSQLPRGFWDFFIDTAEADCLRYLTALATTSQPHLFHVSTFLVAEVDGRPAAGLCGYFDEDMGISALAAVTKEVDEKLGRTPEDGRAGLARAGLFFTVVPEHRPRAWIVENVATRPEFRRRGLVRELLDAILARGVEHGATETEIAVFIGNDRAQRVYENAGFAVSGEKRNPEFEAEWGSPGLRSLHRRL